MQLVFECELRNCPANENAKAIACLRRSVHILCSKRIALSPPPEYSHWDDRFPTLVLSLTRMYKAICPRAFLFSPTMVVCRTVPTYKNVAIARLTTMESRPAFPNLNRESSGRVMSASTQAPVVGCKRARGPFKCHIRTDINRLTNQVRGAQYSFRPKKQAAQRSTPLYCPRFVISP